MLERIDPTKTQAWAKLSDHFQTMRHRHMRKMFQEDPERFSKYSLVFEDILLDYSLLAFVDKVHAVTA